MCISGVKAYLGERQKHDVESHMGTTNHTNSSNDNEQQVNGGNEHSDSTNTMNKMAWAKVLSQASGEAESKSLNTIRAFAQVEEYEDVFEDLSSTATNAPNPSDDEPNGANATSPMESNSGGIMDFGWTKISIPSNYKNFSKMKGRGLLSSLQEKVSRKLFNAKPNNGGKSKRRPNNTTNTGKQGFFEEEQESPEKPKESNNSSKEEDRGISSSDTEIDIRLRGAVLLHFTSKQLKTFVEAVDFYATSFGIDDSITYLSSQMGDSFGNHHGNNKKSPKINFAKTSNIISQATTSSAVACSLYVESVWFQLLEDRKKIEKMSSDPSIFYYSDIWLGLGNFEARYRASHEVKQAFRMRFFGQDLRAVAITKNENSALNSDAPPYFVEQLLEPWYEPLRSTAVQFKDPSTSNTSSSSSSSSSCPPFRFLHSRNKKKPVDHHLASSSDSNRSDIYKNKNRHPTMMHMFLPKLAKNKIKFAENLDVLNTYSDGTSYGVKDTLFKDKNTIFENTGPFYYREKKEDNSNNEISPSLGGTPTSANMNSSSNSAMKTPWQDAFCILLDLDQKPMSERVLLFELKLILNRLSLHFHPHMYWAYFRILQFFSPSDYTPPPVHQQAVVRDTKAFTKYFVNIHNCLVQAPGGAYSNRCLDDIRIVVSEEAAIEEQAQDDPSPKGLFFNDSNNISKAKKNNKKLFDEDSDDDFLFPDQPGKGVSGWTGELKEATQKQKKPLPKTASQTREDAKVGINSVLCVTDFELVAGYGGQSRSQGIKMDMKGVDVLLIDKPANLIGTKLVFPSSKLLRILSNLGFAHVVHAQDCHIFIQNKVDTLTGKVESATLETKLDVVALHMCSDTIQCILSGITEYSALVQPVYVKLEEDIEVRKKRNTCEVIALELPPHVVDGEEGMIFELNEQE